MTREDRHTLAVGDTVRFLSKPIAPRKLVVDIGDVGWVIETPSDIAVWVRTLREPRIYTQATRLQKIGEADA